MSDDLRPANVTSGATGRARWRRWSDVAHRWLGLTTGAVLVVAGLTGTLLAFYVEIEHNWYPHMRSSVAGARPSSFEAVYRRLQEVPRQPGGTWKIEIPPAGGVITSRYTVPDTSIRTRMVTLDPVTLETRRDAFWNDTFFTWIYDLHMYLQLGPDAKPVVGVIALVMVGMFAAGLGSWLLPPGGVRAKLRFKRSSTTARRLYDLHKLTGAATLPLMVLVVVTGAFICLPNQVRPVLNAMSPLKPTEPPVASTPTPGAVRVPVDDALAIAPARFPGSTVVWVRVPSTATGTYDLQIRQAGAPRTRFPRTHLYIDQYTGAILATYDPKQDGWGDFVLNWLVPLHDGKAFGMAGRILVMGLGLVPLGLFVTRHVALVAETPGGCRRDASSTGVGRNAGH